MCREFIEGHSGLKSELLLILEVGDIKQVAQSKSRI